MQTLLVLIALALPLAAEIVDRAAIAIGHQVITESQIDEELRITALLNHQPITRDAHMRREAADRLIQQFLIQRETDVNRYPAPDPSEVTGYVTQVEQDFGGAANLREALAKYHLSEQTYRSHLILQLTTMRFIEFRFQPDPLSKDPVAEQRIDQALELWLNQARKRSKVVYLDETLH